MAVAGNIEALLTLDASGFNTGLKDAISNVEKFAESINSLSKNTNSFEIFQTHISNIVLGLNELSVAFNKVKTFNTLANGLDKMSKSAELFSSSSSSLVETFSTMGIAMKSFTGSLEGAEAKLKGVIQTEGDLVLKANQSRVILENEKKSVYDVTTAFGKMRADLLLTATAVRQHSTQLQTTAEASVIAARNTNQLQSTLNKTSTSVKNASNSFNQLKTGLSSVNSSTMSFETGFNNIISTVNRSRTSFNEAYESLLRLGAGINSFNNIGLTKSNPQVTFSNTVNGLKEVESSMNTVNTASSRLSTGFTNAGNSANKLSTQTRGLAGVMTGLKSIVSMVGSMFLFNFAHNLAVGVSNTIKARSEMYSFLNTMGLTTSQTTSFNQALDQTAERFQKINKYNIGETVANIGMEFDLSAKEMEKAMSVTAMVTSEYLRAGRNADEAALAVKDIMQGEFQRLSRETGVKGDTLKAAGWNGDNTDVMSLMEALEKVATDRHWDTFAEKASSLNDIILITQNRFGEWAAEVSEGVTPVITSSFNSLVMVLDGVTSVFTSIGEALNLPDWTGTVVNIIAFITALNAASLAAITYRTGMGLTQIAHQGLGQSILATIFHIKAEELENTKATSVIAGKILGLNAETVAQHGVKSALGESVMMQKLETLQKEKSKAAVVGKTTSIEAELFAMQHHISVAEAKVLLEERDAFATMSNTSALLTKIFGLEASTVAEEGLTVAMGRKIAASWASVLGLEAETAATMSATAATLTFYTTLGLIIGVIAAVGVALYGLLSPLQAAADKMKKFNDILEQQDNLMDDAWSTRSRFKNQYDEYNKQLSQLTKGTEEYNRVLALRNQAENDLNYATEKYIPNMQKAIQITQQAQDAFDAGKQELAIENERKLSEAFLQAGVDAEIAGMMASTALNDANRGAEILRSTLAGLSDLYDKQYTGEVYWVTKLKNAGIDDSEIEEALSDYNAAHKHIQESYEGYKTSTGFFDKLNYGLGYYYANFELWLAEMNVAAQVGSEELIHTFFGGLLHGIHDLPIVKQVWDFFGGKLSDMFHMENYAHRGFDGLKDMILDDLTGVKDWFINQVLPDSVKDIMISVADAPLDFANFGKDFIKDIMHMVIPKDISFLNGWVDDFVDFVFGFVSDGFNYLTNLNLGDYLPDFDLFGKILDFILPSPVSAEGSEGSGRPLPDVVGFLNDNLFKPIGDALTNFFNDPLGSMGLDFDIVGFFTRLFGDAYNGVTGWVNDNIITPFSDGITNGLSNIPILGDILSMLGLIDDADGTASDKGTGLADAFGQAFEDEVAKIPILGDILKVLGVIDQSNPTAKSKGHNVGSNVKQGVSDGQKDTHKIVGDEMTEIINAVKGAVRGVYNAAVGVGSAILGGINSIIQHHSPGVPAKLIAAEMGEIVNAMDSNVDSVYSSAQSIGGAVTDAIQPSFDVGDYKVDAGVINSVNSSITSNSIATFAQLDSTVSGTMSNMSGSITNTMNGMSSTQSSMLSSMQSTNKTSFDNIQKQTNNSLGDMRDSTARVTQQMTNAWVLMKDNIVSSANQLQSQSSKHFTTLSSNISSFYRKLQNPTLWGAGDRVVHRSYNSSRGKKGISAVNRVYGSTKHGAGVPSRNTVMSIGSIKKMVCPSGDCKIFDGFDSDRKVDVYDFLGMLGLDMGWNGWNVKHFNHIKKTTGDYNMASPRLLNYIDSRARFFPKEFYNGKPQVSFSQFQTMAEALFSNIPYDFYMDSAKTGHWTSALMSGSVNCSDGADALLALAATCGFSGSKVHTTLGNGLGHFYTVINGKAMDTTAWQNRRSWTPLGGGAGSAGKVTNKEVTVNIDMRDTVIYGVDDLEEHIYDATRRALKEEINPSPVVGY